MANGEEKKYSKEEILDMLMSASFERWYINEFMDFVEGEENAVDKEAILKRIEQLCK